MSEKELSPKGLNMTQINGIKNAIINLTYIINNETFDTD